MTNKTRTNKTRFLAGAAAIVMLAGPVFAQQTQPQTTPTQPARPAAPAQAQQPATPAPAQPARPATPAPAQAQQPAAPATPARPAQQQPAAAQPATPAAPARPTAAPAAAPAATQGQRVNLNTATKEQLDTLPQIGDARANAIITERAKGRFRNWDDFVQRMNGTAVNQTAKDAIKDRVAF